MINDDGQKPNTHSTIKSELRGFVGMGGESAAEASAIDFPASSIGILVLRFRKTCESGRQRTDVACDLCGSNNARFRLNELCRTDKRLDFYWLRY
jgi:hypothetical protein